MYIIFVNVFHAFLLLSICMRFAHYIMVITCRRLNLRLFLLCYDYECELSVMILPPSAVVPSGRFRWSFLPGKPRSLLFYNLYKKWPCLGFLNQYRSFGILTNISLDICFLCLIFLFKVFWSLMPPVDHQALCR